MLTDQVEVQGEKIRDLDKSLELHREKLNAAEELLQQVRPLPSLNGNESCYCFRKDCATLLTIRADPQELLNRTALETQKLELMTEVSSLKLKLATLERDHRGNEVRCPPPSAL